MMKVTRIVYIKTKKVRFYVLKRWFDNNDLEDKGTQFTSDME